jgi:hypothetical protein
MSCFGLFPVIPVTAPDPAHASPSSIVNQIRGVFRILEKSLSEHKYRVAYAYAHSGHEVKNAFCHLQDLGYVSVSLD